MGSEIAIEKVFYVINPDGKYVLEKFKGFVSAESLITPYDIEPLKRDGFIIPGIQEGQTITKHPYRKEYIFLDEETEDEIVLDRIRILGEILTLLGAKEFHVSQNAAILNDEKKNKTLFAGWRALFPEEDITGKLGLEKKHKETEKLNKDLKIDSYSKWPGVYTKEDYKKAQDLANQYGYKKGSLIDSLINQREPSLINKNEELRESFDVRTDLEKCLSYSTTLKAQINAAMEGDTTIEVGGKAGKKDDYSFKSTKQTSIEFNVKFGPLVESSLNRDNDELEETTTPQTRTVKRVLWIVGSIVAAIATGLAITLL